MAGYWSTCSMGSLCGRTCIMHRLLCAIISLLLLMKPWCHPLLFAGSPKPPLIFSMMTPDVQNTPQQAASSCRLGFEQLSQSAKLKACKRSNDHPLCIPFMRDATACSCLESHALSVVSNEKYTQLAALSNVSLQDNIPV